MGARGRRGAAARAAASGGEVALATTADGLVEGPTTDRALIEAALDRLAPAGGGAAAWPQLAGADAVHFITDGAIARPLDPASSSTRCSRRRRTSAITAFDVRPSLGGGAAGDAYLEVANFAPRAAGAPHARRAARRRSSIAGSTWRPAKRSGRSCRSSAAATASCARTSTRAGQRAGHRRRGGRLDRARAAAGGDGRRRADRVAARPVRRRSRRRATFVDAGRVPARAAKTSSSSIAGRRRSRRRGPRSTSRRRRDARGSPGRAGSDDAGGEKRRSGRRPAIASRRPRRRSVHARRSSSAHALRIAAAASRSRRRRAGTPLVSVDDVRRTGRASVVVTFGRRVEPGLGAGVSGAGRQRARVAAGRPGGAGARADRSATASRVTARRRRRAARAPARRASACCARRALRRRGRRLARTFAVNVTTRRLQPRGSSVDAARGIRRRGRAAPWWLYCAVAAFAAVLLEWWTWQRRITV